MGLLNPPLVTVYTRTIDASTMRPVTNWEYIVPFSTTDPATTSGTLTSNITHDIALNSTLNYGILNALTGGDSQYIIEFDIWNNEPSFSAGFAFEPVSDVVNLKMFVQDSDTSATVKNTAPQTVANQPGSSVVYVRCITNDYNTEFVPIPGPQGFDQLYGNVSPTLTGTLHGANPSGDHVHIQTKITLQPNTPKNTYNFVFGLSYDYYPQIAPGS